MDTAALIVRNHFAPADTLIRTLFECGLFTRFKDNEEMKIIPDLQSALELWYNLDELTLIFDDINSVEHPQGLGDHFVKLYHQGKFTDPCFEDIGDYYTQTAGLSPELEAAFNPDEDWMGNALTKLTEMLPAKEGEGAEFDPKGAGELIACECGNTHEACNTVCRWCWSKGRRKWADPDIA